MGVRLAVVRNLEFGFETLLFQMLDRHSDKDFGWVGGYDCRGV